MNYVMHSPLKLCLTALALVFTLAACSAGPAVVPLEPSSDITHIATVEVSAEFSQAELEDMYGGQTIVYKPDAGFAVLGFTKAQSELTSLSTEPNSEVSNTVQGSSVWGSSVWGSSVWGSSVWGSSVWGSGVWGSGSTLPPESEASLSLINITAAHAASSNYGSGIKVAIIDTGLDLDHTMFQGRLAPASEWKDFIDGDNTPEDDPYSSVYNGFGFGHGTAVAGLVVQVAPNATILPIRVLNANGYGVVSDLVAAIDHAIINGADVINLSLGTNENVKSLANIIKYASRQQVHVTMASGNGGFFGLDYPASYAMTGKDQNYLLSVGSSDANGNRSWFSNYSSYLEFIAPGEQLFSAYPGDLASSNTGTSFAAPIVAGIVALGLSETTSLPALEGDLANSTGTPSNWLGKVPKADHVVKVFNPSPAQPLPQPAPQPLPSPEDPVYY